MGSDSMLFRSQEVPNFQIVDRYDTILILIVSLIVEMEQIRQTSYLVCIHV